MDTLRKVTENEKDLFFFRKFDKNTKIAENCNFGFLMALETDEKLDTSQVFWEYVVSNSNRLRESELEERSMEDMLQEIDGQKIRKIERKWKETAEKESSKWTYGYRKQRTSQ